MVIPTRQPTKPTNQLSVGEFQTRYDKYETKSHPKQKRFDQGIINMMAVDGVPFNFVNGLAFKALVQELDRKITVKSRSTYTTKLQNFAKSQVIPDLKKKLKSLDRRSCHFSCDVWTTKRRESVLGILCHYVSAEWTLCKVVIAFKRLTESHTAEYIHNTFLECIRELGVPPGWVI